MKHAWQMIEAFGFTHLMIPRGQSTVCRYFPNLNGPVTTIDNIRKNVTCAECRQFASDLCLPTA